MPTGIDAGTIYSDIRVALDKLRGDVAQVKASFDKIATSSSAPSKKVEKNWTSSFKKVGLAGTAAIAAVTVAFKSAVSTFAKTEQSLANVRAVTGATAEEFAELEKAAEQAGQKTRFTASEAADALFFLSSAGFDAAQSVAALDGVLLLAGATGSDLSQSAQTVTATLSQFNLTAAESIDVVNTFAAANSNSQATLSRIQGALRQVGPVAGGLNKSLEETVGVLQLLFNAGFEGENAGRALKSALADLGNESSIAVKKLGDLGISYEKINPQTNSLAEVFGALKEAGLGTTEALDVFGKVAGSQVSILIKEGEDAINEYTEAVTGTNEAARQYEVQNDTLAGSFDKFKSALEGTTNSIIKELAPALRALVDFGSKVLNFITGLPSPLKAVGGAMGTAALAVGVLTKAMTFLGISSTAALGPIGLIIGAVTALGLLINSATKDYRELGKAADNLNDAQERSSALVNELRAEYEQLAAKENLSAEEKIRQAELINELKEILPELTLAQIENTEELDKATLANARNNKQLAEQAKATYEASKAITESKLNQLLLEKRAAFDRANRGLFDAEEAERRFQETLKDTGPQVNILKGELNDLNYVIDATNKTIEEENKVIDELTEKLNKNTKAVNDNNDANGETETAVERQIRLRKEIEAELAASTARINQERDLGLISAKEKTNALIAANEKLVRSLLDIDYTGLTNELGDQAIKRALALIATLEKANEEKNEKIIQGEWETTQDVIAFYKKQADIKGAIRENQLAEELDAQKKKNEEEKEEEEKHAADMLYIRNQLTSKILSLYNTLVSEINRGYQADKDNEIKAVEEKVANKVLTEEEGAKKIAKINYEKAKADWDAQNLAIIGNTAQAASVALASAPFPLNLIPLAFAAAQGGIQLATQIKTKPKAPRLQTGGIVFPQPGGVPTVQAENGFPELSLNGGPSGRALLKEFAAEIAAQMNGSGGVTLIQNNTLNTDTIESVQAAARVLGPALQQENKRAGNV